ncbi:contractile injection system protein, VgrG/Pvc8 family, partial [Gilliamella sp. Pas-s27]|uniref:contractile injection system protein, VgrG/Pvc8 family n=1 Tax=Gilliamella sp. Pas-s27 TaxID=2687311 RepID=UPI00210681A0
MVDKLGEGLVNGLIDGLKSVSHNRYTLTVEGLGSPVSVLQVKGDEPLNQPWHYTITFTSPDKALSLDSLLNQHATFSFNPVINKPLSTAIRSLSDLPTVSDARRLHGVITAFSQLSVSKEQAHYEVVLSSRLALLALEKQCAIYQNQSVVSVVE